MTRELKCRLLRFARFFICCWCLLRLETAGISSAYAAMEDKRRAADQLLLQAKQAAENREWPTAISLGEQAAELLPSDAGILEFLSVLHNNCAVDAQAAGFSPAAERHFRVALRYAPQNRRILRNYAGFFVEQAYSAYEKGNLDQAQAQLGGALRIDPDNAPAQALSGEIAYRRGDYAVARRLWEQALSVDPGLTAVAERLQRLEKEQRQQDQYRVYTGMHFTVQYDRDLPEAIPAAAGGILEEAYREIGQYIDCFPRERIFVLLHRASAFNELATSEEWTAGVYDGKIRIRADSVDSVYRLRQVLYHEYTHAVVFTLTHDRCPLWLNEGLAEYCSRKQKSGAHHKQQRRRLLAAADQSRLPDLLSLHGHDMSVLSDKSPEEIAVFYAQAGEFVGYLLERFGAFRMRQLLTDIGRGESWQSRAEYIWSRPVSVLYREWITVGLSSS